jgi:hypothetical protein
MKFTRSLCTSAARARNTSTTQVLFRCLGGVAIVAACTLPVCCEYRSSSAGIKAESPEASTAMVATLPTHGTVLQFSRVHDWREGVIVGCHAELWSSPSPGCLVPRPSRLLQSRLVERQRCVDEDANRFAVAVVGVLMSVGEYGDPSVQFVISDEDRYRLFGYLAELGDQHVAMMIGDRIVRVFCAATSIDDAVSHCLGELGGPRVLEMLNCLSAPVFCLDGNLEMPK